MKGDIAPRLARKRAAAAVSEKEKFGSDLLSDA
jgi:hypothetical protein